MKTAVQMIGLVRGTPGEGQKHRANGRGIFAEMGEERATHSETYDPSRTEMNVYDQEEHSGIDVWDEMDQESREYKMQVRGKTKTGEEIIRERSLRKDAVIGVAIIINPPYEDTKDWTVSEYERFYKDTNDALAEFCPEIFRIENKKFGVRHLDEGHSEAEGLDEHKHEVFSCIDQDGKYCGNRIDARFLSDFNKFYPQAMRDRGWTQMEDLETTNWDRMKTDPEYQVYRAKKLGGQRLTTNEVLHQAAEKKYERAEEELESAIQANVEAQGLKSEAESMVSDAADKVKQMNGELEDAKSEKQEIVNSIESAVKDVDFVLRVDELPPDGRETYNGLSSVGKADLLRQVVRGDVSKKAQLEKDIPELESRKQTLESEYAQRSEAYEELKNKNVNLETVVIPQNQQKAKKIISDANDQAENIVSDAKDQARTIKSEAEIEKKQLEEELPGLRTEKKTLEGDIKDLEQRKESKQAELNKIDSEASETLQKASEQAENIVSDANDQAKTIKSKAETEAKQLNEELPELRTEKETLKGDIKDLEQRKESKQAELNKIDSEASETLQKASEQAEKIIGEAYQVKYHTVQYPNLAAANYAINTGEVNGSDVYVIYPDSARKCPIPIFEDEYRQGKYVKNNITEDVESGKAMVCADVPEDRIVVPKTVFNKIIDCLDRLSLPDVVKDFIDKFKSSDPDRNRKDDSWSEPDGHGAR